MIFSDPTCETDGANAKMTGAGTFECTIKEKKKKGFEIHTCVATCDHGGKPKGAKKTNCRTKTKKGKTAFEWFTKKNKMINCE